MKQYVKIISYGSLLISFQAFARVDYSLNGTFLAGSVDAHHHTQNPNYVYGDLHGYINLQTEKPDGWNWGFFLELETEKHNPLEEAYAYTQNDWIRFELGCAKNMAEKTHIALPDSTGIRFNRESYIYDLFDLKNVTPLSSTALTTDNYTQKISFISKTWNGFQIGGSYLPSLLNKSQTKEGILDEETIKDGFVGTLIYKYDGGYTKFATSIGYGEFNDLQNFHVDPLGLKMSSDKRKEISAGMNLNLGGWTIGLSGRKINEKDHPLNPTSDSQEGVIYGAGIGYEFLMFNTNISFQHTEIEGNKSIAKKDKTDLAMWGLSYKYNQNLKLWTALGYAKFTDESDLDSNGNRGGFFTLGGTFNF
ncbi:MAG: porin [Alphaproteobacteria bacterium]|nr:porin [Alphaproteobacteria bacterium]